MSWCGQELIVCPFKYKLCVGVEAVVKEFRKLEVHEEQWTGVLGSTACCVFMERTKEGSVCIVFLSDLKGVSDDEILGILAHESVHIWQRARDIMTEECPSGEFEAYSIQQVFMNLLQEYRIVKAIPIEVKEAGKPKGKKNRPKEE